MSELAGLQWTDFDLDNGLIHVQRQKIPGEGLVNKTKSGSDRIVAIPRGFISLLKSEKLSSRSKFVINLDCSYWKQGRQSKIIKDFCRKIGIKKITFHQLRATHITLAIVDNISLGIIKENVGHSKLSTTDIYFRSSGVNLAGQTDGLKLKLPSEADCKVVSLNKK